MRPTRIEVEGFSAYRELVTVDFEGVDFFSLTGPTGSGKSSLIDAMVFALFGRVPRLGGNAVAPAITAGADRARVRLDFEVGETGYTAVRMAQRTSTGGATVKEARLQQGDRVLADGADHVTDAVEDLIKLRYEDFTRTVVLPQGDFARFLTATKSERQGLLRNLLGMEVYTKVRELAKTREAVAAERAEGARRTLETLELADEDEMARAVDRRDRLLALAGSMPDWEKRMDGLDAEMTTAETQQKGISDSIDRLAALEAPGRLTELDELVAKARSALVDATEARSAALEKVQTADAGLTDLPSVEQVVAWKKTRERLAAIDKRLATPENEETKERANRAERALAEGLERLEQVRSELVAVRSEHAAHVLAATLSEGDPCPVCAQEVVEVPRHPSPPGLDELIEKESQNADLVDALRRDLEETRAALTRIEANQAGLREQRIEVLAELEGVPSEVELADLEDELKRLRTLADSAREELTARDIEEKKAQGDLEGLADDARRVAKLLTSAQLKVADLDPPVPESDDVVVQWKELITWREQTLDRLRTELDEVEAVVTGAKLAATAAREELAGTLKKHDVAAREPYAVEVATELQTARSLVDSQLKAARDAVQLEEQAGEASSEAAVAGALATHLRANGFEQWLMAGALNDLVSGANELLGQLSNDSYSLHSDESGSFSIVDHRNANEMRSVSTLSGGETFLVSLALALSLAETLAAKGGSGLDAIILDEGFGTLDDESLDTVASVLEELTGRGLMVGVITHVKELAARAPVRYEVRREAGGAAVRLAS